MIIIVIKNSRESKIINIEADIMCNSRGFFACKSIKYTMFQKIISNIKDHNIWAIRFEVYVNKLTYTYSYISKTIISFENIWVIFWNELYKLENSLVVMEHYFWRIYKLHFLLIDII